MNPQILQDIIQRLMMNQSGGGSAPQSTPWEASPSSTYVGPSDPRSNLLDDANPGAQAGSLSTQLQMMQQSQPANSAWESAAPPSAPPSASNYGRNPSQWAPATFPDNARSWAPATFPTNTPASNYGNDSINDPRPLSGIIQSLMSMQQNPAYTAPALPPPSMAPPHTTMPSPIRPRQMGVQGTGPSSAYGSGGSQRYQPSMMGGRPAYGGYLGNLLAMQQNKRRQQNQMPGMSANI